MRRGRLPANSKEVYLDGELTLEGSGFIVSVHGKRVLLSGQEWWLLRCLAKQAGRVVAQEELVAILWGEDRLMHEHELARHVQALKQKIENQYAGLIEAIPGVGYRLTSYRH